MVYVLITDEFKKDRGWLIPLIELYIDFFRELRKLVEKFAKEARKLTDKRVRVSIDLPSWSRNEYNEGYYAVMYSNYLDFVEIYRVSYEDGMKETLVATIYNLMETI